MKTEILITGATGTTGRYAVESLINKGVNVRAMVRTIDKRSEKLEEIGAEVVQGNFLDLNSLRIALKGIKKVYLCYPFQDKLPKGAGYFAKAAKENEVDLIFDKHEGLIPIEIKAAMTFNDNFVKGIKYFQKISKKASSGYVIYSGNLSFKSKDYDVINFAATNKVFEDI